ncbi:MAG: Lrp/AsnC family transcriptional regulator [Oscillospiraceae bacterium]
MNNTDKKLLDLLRQNARLSNSELAAMLAVTEKEVAEGIARLEAAGIVIGYSAIINEELADDQSVTAIIELKITPVKDMGFDDLAHTIMQFPEVDTVILLSGANDLSVTISGTSMRKVALFVSEQLAVLDGVLSTTTHFVLRRYKEKGHVFGEDRSDERSMVSP